MNRSTVEEIKLRLPIEDVISSYVKLEKAGKSLKAKCPFHNEKSASFFVSPERGGYYCFGCGAKGDVFSFIEQFEGLDFKGALKVLAERAGVPLIMDKKADSERDQLFDITEQAAQYFEVELKKSPEALNYLKQRGINAESIKHFQIGWAPEGWRNLSKHLRSKGWSEAIIEKAGLAKRRENDPSRTAQKSGDEFYDRFRGRIIFPINDSSGRVVAFTGRILRDDGKSAKYLNSPDTPLYNKSAILFGLDKAKTEIRRVGYSILVEGQMDLVLAHQVGTKNTIAASGTALTDVSQGETGMTTNIGMVRRLSPNMIIAMDSDAAGRAAAMRAVASTALAMGMSVKIADISGGKDPADLIVSDPESWKTVLKNAKHVISYEFENVLRDVTENKKRPSVVRSRVFPFLSKIDKETDKAEYVKLIAEGLAISEQAVWEDLRRYERENKDQKKADTLSKSSAMDPVHRTDLIERRMFGLLNLMDRAKTPQAAQYSHQIRDISGTSYEARMAKIGPIQGDISFEAESFFGTDPDKWDVHMRELILNFEEDVINQELMASMVELRTAEKAGDQTRMAEMAKKCQVLSIRKGELGKKRKH